MKDSRALLAASLTLACSACSAGGSGSSPNPVAPVGGGSSPVTGAGHARGAAAFTIRIPHAAAAASASVAGGATPHRPQYVSVNTASATITVTTVNGGSVPAGYAPTTVALTTASSACATVNANLQCTLDVPAPVGVDGFTVTLFDAGGQALSTNSASVTVVAGQTTTASPLVLGGIAASYLLTPATDAATAAHVSASGGGYRILGMLPYTFSVQPVDASGATIVGPGTPPVTLTNASSNVIATASSGQSYAIKVVRQSAAPVSLSVQSAGGATVSVPIVTAPEYFVCDAGNEAIRAYDINGTVATPIPSDGMVLTSVNFGGIALDGAGHIWVSDESSGVKSYNPGSTTVLTSITVAGPWQIAFDPSGTLYAESYSSQMNLDGYNASSGALLSTSTSVGFTDSGPLAIDSLGQLWFGNEYYTNTVIGYTKTGTQIGALSFSSLTPNALAFDSSGLLWMGSSSAVSAYNTTTGAIIAGSTITAGVSYPVAIRFDPAGDIIVLNTSSAMNVYSPAGSLIRTISLPNASNYVNDMAIAP